MTHLCLSIAPATVEQAREMIRTHGKTGELIEVRIDAMNSPDLQRLLQRPRPPMIITNRSVREGGRFRGTAAEHLALMRRAVACGAEYIDTDVRWGGRITETLLSIAGSTRIILSSHESLRTPPHLERRYRSIKRFRPYCIKFAALGRSLADVGRMINLTENAHRRGERCIGISMGEIGHITRIGAGLFGSYLIYASVGDAQPTGAGQLSMTEMTSVYRAHRANRRTALFGLIGNPVRQSAGYLLHNETFRKRHINAMYVRIPVEDLDAFMQILAHRFKGFSVTMPWKEDIVPFMDSLDGIARSLGMVNTVIRRRGRWFGYNTDYPAILTCLTRRVTLKGKSVVVWGTGATAATMAAVAADSGAHVTITGRRTSEAESLAFRLGCSWIPMKGLHSLHPDIVMNGTPVGMNDGDIIPSSIRRLVHRGTIVLDAVYRPQPTPLVQLAKRNRGIVIDGWEFFRQQALLQSRIFCAAL